MGPFGFKGVLGPFGLGLKSLWVWFLGPFGFKGSWGPLGGFWVPLYWVLGPLGFKGVLGEFWGPLDGFWVPMGWVWSHFGFGSWGPLGLRGLGALWVGFGVTLGLGFGALWV